MKKAQGALEYLMTYGWAILVVVIVGLVLWRSGVFGTSSTGASGFDVLVPAEWKIVTNGGNYSVTNSQIVFRNVAGQTLRNVNITTSDDGGSTYHQAYFGTASTASVGAGQEKTVNASISCTSGASATVQVKVIYTTTSGLQHTDTGTIYADCES